MQFTTSQVSHLEYIEAEQFVRLFECDKLEFLLSFLYCSHSVISHDNDILLLSVVVSTERAKNKTWNL